MTDTADTETDAAAIDATDPVRLDRRDVLGLRSLAGLGAALGGVSVLAAACNAVGESTNPDMVLMKRATYGVTQSVIDRVGAIGATAWIAEQLAPETLDTAALDAKLATMPALEMTPAELRRNYPDNDIADAAVQLVIATTMRQLESPAQLHERMVEFWSDHFNVPISDQILRLLKVVEDREVIRPRALGKFKDLLVASAQSPAMLYYLDNAVSTAGNINENYGRELLELHTLGVDNGYTEDDVVNTARLLTGWSIDPTTGLFQFRPAVHDTGPMTIVGWVRPGGTNYLAHGVQFLHHLATHPNTATHLCTKLVRRFVDDRPDPAMVDHLASVYLANDTDIRPVLTALFTHPTFLASAGRKFRRPQEYLVAVSRQVGASLAPALGIGDAGALGGVALGLGQTPFQWPAPNGYPDVAAAWLNTGGLLARWNAAADVASGVFPNLTYDTAPIRSGIGTRPVGEMLDIVADRVLHEPLTNEGRAVIASALGVTVTDERNGNWLYLNIRRMLLVMLATDDNQFT